jgi:hypothetical protein
MAGNEQFLWNMLGMSGVSFVPKPHTPIPQADTFDLPELLDYVASH